MSLHHVLLAAASLLLVSCGQDKFDQRYKDAEAQIRKEDRDLASQLPSASPAAAQPGDASSEHP